MTENVRLHFLKTLVSLDVGWCESVSPNVVDMLKVLYQLEGRQ